MGGTMVWLRSGASLEHMQMMKRQVQADFLSGGITSGYMAGSDFSYANVRVAKPVPTNSRGYQCSAESAHPACQAPTEKLLRHQTDWVLRAAPDRFAEAVRSSAVDSGLFRWRECSVGC